jgi:DNA replication protein DnaC
MNWTKFLEINKIGTRFHDVDIKKVLELIPHYRDSLELFLKKKNSLLLHGKPGRGKTYTSLAIIKLILEKENPFNIRFIKAKVIDDIALDYSLENKSPENFLRVIRESKYLFIDDFGVDKATDRVIKDLYHIIDYRWENCLPTVISTNLKNPEIEANYGERISSRLNNFDKIFFGGNDLRESY